MIDISIRGIIKQNEAWAAVLHLYVTMSNRNIQYQMRKMVIRVSPTRQLLKLNQ